MSELPNQLPLAEGYFEALSKLELPPLPESAEFSPGSERLSRLGDIALFRAGWGEWVPTSVIIDNLKTTAHEPRLMEQIEKLGFNGSYRHQFGSDLYSERGQRIQAGWATRLVLPVLEARGWDHIDGLFIGSSTIGDEAVDLITENLNELGIGTGLVQHHSLACQSWTSGLVEGLSRQEFEGQNVVVVGMDTLSPIANPREPITFATFGNGGGAVAVVPDQDMIHITGSTQIEFDTTESTVCTPASPLPPLHSRREYPKTFRLANPETAQYFAVSDRGVYLDNPHRIKEHLIRMNGRATFTYFVISGGTIPLMHEVIENYDNNILRSVYGDLGVPFGHQPSLEVLSGLNKYSLKTYQKQGWKETPPQFTWVMDETGFNNVSAGTGLIAWEEMVHRKMLTKHSTHLMLGLGVGASIGAHVVHFA